MNRRERSEVRAIGNSLQGLPIELEENGSGFNVDDKEGKISFPLESGSEFGTAEHCLHELAHFLEIDRKRAFQENFGFNYKVTTDAPVRRELRVIAIEHRIHDAYGFKFDPDPVIGTLHYGIPSVATVKWHNHYDDDNLIEWCRLARNFYLACYASFDEIWLMRRWNARMASLRKWSNECRRKHARR